jgi:UDP-3-O-[3-hydroxymyristoyl] glucosamine N-acyltransferase
MDFQIIYNGLPAGLERTTAAELAARIGATVEGDGLMAITGLGDFESGGADKIGFITDPKDAPKLQKSGLGAVVAPLEGAFPGPKAVLRVKDPKIEFCKIMLLFVPDPVEEPGVHPTAVVEDGASLGENVTIGAFAVIRSGAVIHDGCVIGAHAYVGQQTVIGERSVLFPNVVVYHRCRIGKRVRIHSGTVIGADGFGYEYRSGKGHVKIPQCGGVHIGDDVEIGANSCVDCGTIRPTTVGNGAKIDNFVQIAHNDKIGPLTILCGHVGLAGSVTTGIGAIIGGMAGVKDHAHIGDGAKVAGGARVHGDVAPGETVAGEASRPIGEWRKIQAILSRLPEIYEEVKKLKQRIADLEAQLSDHSSSH